ncbi:MAG: hypothetical protein INF16_08290 [Methylobacterium sp.]|nr:hypothetical protein [Methylobacterium sp.]
MKRPPKNSGRFMWSWKDAYEAVEAAQVLFLRQFGASIFGNGRSPAQILSILERLGALLPTETRRSETSQALQQFSTPVELAFVAARAALVSPMISCSSLRPERGCSLFRRKSQVRSFCSMNGPRIGMRC